MSHLSFDNLVVSDREVIDMLDSQKQRVTKTKLINYLQQRGIICSNNDSRETLIDYISTLTIDWHLIEDILSLAESTETQQKVTAQTIRLDDPKVLKKTLENLEEIYKNKNFNVNPSNNSYEINYANETIEKNNTRLIQRKTKDEKINIKVNANEITIINTVGDGTETIINRIVHELERNSKNKIDRKTIDFSNIYTSSIINEFFIKLIDLDDQYIREDVVKIKFNKFDSNKSEEFEIQDELDLDISDEFNSEPPAPQSNSTTNTSDIKSALLSGSSLLTSEFFEKFSSQDYFISHIRWKFKEKNVTAPKTFEFSASFDLPDSRKSLNFEAIKYFKHDKSTGKAQATSQKWKGNEKHTIEMKLYKIALSIYDNLIDDRNGGEFNG